jgi:hypothetical protein
VRADVGGRRTAGRDGAAFGQEQRAVHTHAAIREPEEPGQQVSGTAVPVHPFDGAALGTDGGAGAAQCFLVWHQVSQEATAARLRFQVAGALAPHSSVSAVPISASATSASGRSRPRWPMTRSMAEA